MSFSGVLQITDLNDFITPSQECVMPVKLEKKDGKTGTLKITEDGQYLNVLDDGSVTKLEKAKITLNDCLACSGCITSAESVLIAEQSQDELYRVLRENKKKKEESCEDTCSCHSKTVVVSISPQSRASLAVKHQLSASDTMHKLTRFFHSLGVDYVLDTTFAREYSLLECQREFVRRYKARDTQPGQLPMLASSCPGWICYAEKSHGHYILPYISNVKSPQQIMGSLVKDYLANKLGKKPNEIYHVTVMPCFDKKLEASRSDFYDSSYETRDVDCVITSIEVQAMLEKEEVCLSDLESDELDSLDGVISDGLYSHAGSTSGGYCEQIFLYAAAELFNESKPEIQYKVMRNQDLKELTLVKDGEEVLKFAIANGFRNIQNIVQKLKRGKSPYHFVEIMACPSGCANGGAQIRESRELAQDLLKKVEAVYDSLPTQAPGQDPKVTQLYDTWLGGAESSKAEKMLHTTYHAINKDGGSLSIKW